MANEEPGCGALQTHLRFEWLLRPGSLLATIYNKTWSLAPVCCQEPLRIHGVVELEFQIVELYVQGLLTLATEPASFAVHDAVSCATCISTDGA